MARSAGFAVFVALCLASALVGAPALAHLDTTSAYTYRSCPATEAARVDPINVVFTGWGTWGRAESQIRSHAGWTDDSGTTQSFFDHAACAGMHTQRASGRGTRYHVRLRGQHADAVLGWTTTGDAHHEDLVAWPVPCGHAVDSDGAQGSGFDQGRDALGERFAAAGHGTYRVWWGNTQSFKQCDGDYASSDGWVVFIELHRVNH